MPLYIIAIQNAVPYNMLGVATSSGAFFRSIGGSVGLAILGSVMNNRFASELTAHIPGTIKVIIPPERLDALVHNPQALLSPEAQSQLRNLLEQMGPQGLSLFQQVLQALRQALDSALSQVFLVGLLILVVAFVVNLFIKEIPLRKQHMLANPPLERKAKDH
jgi:hypothetical protein